MTLEDCKVALEERVICLSCLLSHNSNLSFVPTVQLKTGRGEETDHVFIPWSMIQSLVRDNIKYYQGELAKYEKE
jgi:hypothetical protein